MGISGFKKEINMDTIECIYQRRSIRKFKKDPIDEGLIDELLQAAMAAPSACNKQPWAFLVVEKFQIFLPSSSSCHCGLWKYQTLTFNKSK